ncbi:hypothetical protein D3C75_1326730 [compost metagenome]
MPAVLSSGGKDEEVPALVQRKGHDLAFGGRAPPFGERLNVRQMGHAFDRYDGTVSDHSGKARLLVTQ